MSDDSFLTYLTVTFAVANLVLAVSIFRLGTRATPQNLARKEAEAAVARNNRKMADEVLLGGSVVGVDRGGDLRDGVPDGIQLDSDACEGARAVLQSSDLSANVLDRLADISGRLGKLEVTLSSFVVDVHGSSGSSVAGTTEGRGSAGSAGSDPAEPGAGEDV